MPVTIGLSKPIQAHDKEVSALTLRDLTAKDIRVLGFPFTITKDGAVAPDSAIIARYVVTLAAIPTSSVDQMAPADFMAVTEAVMGFFGTAKAG